MATDPIPLSAGAYVSSNPPDPAFDAWAAERGRALLTYATAVTGNRESAHDAVQDALVAVYQRWNRLITKGDPDAYARRVIINRHISWWRRLGRRERLSAFDIDRGTDPALDQRTADADVARRLLATLPVRQRAAWRSASTTTCRSPRSAGSWTAREHRPLVRAPGAGSSSESSWRR